MAFFGLDSKDKKKDGGLSAFGKGIGLQYNRIVSLITGIFDNTFDNTFN